FFIDPSFFSMHVARGNDAYLLAVFSRSEGNVQQPACLCLPQCVKSRFGLAVSHVLKHEYRCAKKYLFRLALTYLCFSWLLRWFPSSQSNPSICARSNIKGVYYYNIRDSAKDLR